jgi:hypothetical protein
MTTYYLIKCPYYGESWNLVKKMDDYCKSCESQEDFVRYNKKSFERFFKNYKIIAKVKTKNKYSAIESFVRNETVINNILDEFYLEEYKYDKIKKNI